MSIGAHSFALVPRIVVAAIGRIAYPLRVGLRVKVARFRNRMGAAGIEPNSVSFLKMNIQSFEHPSHSQCQIAVIQKTVSTETLAQAESIFLLVRGMGCPICAACVRNSLLCLDDVFAVFISLKWGLVEVFYDPACVRPESLTHAVAKAGDAEQHHYTARILA